MWFIDKHDGRDRVADVVNQAIVRLQEAGSLAKGAREVAGLCSDARPPQRHPRRGSYLLLAESVLN